MTDFFDHLSDRIANDALDRLESSDAEHEENRREGFIEFRDHKWWISARDETLAKFERQKGLSRETTERIRRLRKAVS